MMTVCASVASLCTRPMSCIPLTHTSPLCRQNYEVYRADNPLTQPTIAENTAAATEDAVNSILPELGHSRLCLDPEPPTLTKPDPLASPAAATVTPKPEPQPQPQPQQKRVPPGRVSPNDQPGKRDSVAAERAGCGQGWEDCIESIARLSGSNVEGVFLKCSKTEFQCRLSLT